MTDLIDITKILDKKNIKVGLEGTTKEEVLLELVTLLSKNGYIADAETFYQDVLLREMEGLTGLGSGIAIPHGKSQGVSMTTLAIGKTKNPIEWESLDEQPVTVIILFAVKNQDATTVHIKLLQKVAIMLADDHFLTELCNSTNEEEMYQLLINKSGGEKE